MEFKTFFNHYQSASTPQAKEFYREVEEALVPIIEKWAALGYTYREIYFLIHQEANVQCASRTLKFGLETRQAEREAPADAPKPQKPPTRYTLAELAELSGFEERTIRYYIYNKLIGGALGVGQAAYYEQRHLDALKLLKDLKADRMSLAEIKEAIAEHFKGE
jgi:hypothetical protein